MVIVIYEYKLVMSFFVEKLMNLWTWFLGNRQCYSTHNV